MNLRRSRKPSEKMRALSEVRVYDPTGSEAAAQAEEHIDVCSFEQPAARPTRRRAMSDLSAASEVEYLF